MQKLLKACHEMGIQKQLGLEREVHALRHNGRRGDKRTVKDMAGDFLSPFLFVVTLLLLFAKLRDTGKCHFVTKEESLSHTYSIQQLQITWLGGGKN